MTRFVINTGWLLFVGYALLCLLARQEQQG